MGIIPPPFFMVVGWYKKKDPYFRAFLSASGFSFIPR